MAEHVLDALTRARGLDTVGRVVMRALPMERFPFLVTHTLRLLRSYHRWTGRELLAESGTPDELAGRLWSHPVIVLSHGTEADPMLNYGNQAALTLWEMTWDEWIATPSRLTAEPVAQDERARLLADASRRGYLDHYQGVRITRTGRRFFVDDATIWTVLDEADRVAGQAATFHRWRHVP